MAHDHIIPQQMIRRFADAEGLLLEFRKPELTLGTRGRRPKGILFAKKYYTDCLGSIDRDWLTRVENDFGRFYGWFIEQNGRVVLEPKQSGLLLEWGLSLLVRGRFFERVVASLKPPSTPFARASLNNQRYVVMRELFEGFRRLGEVGWVFQYPDRNLVLSDTPVLLHREHGDFSLVLPLSRNHLCVFGVPETHDHWNQCDATDVNCLFFGWAERVVYCADASELERIQARVTIPSDAINPAWQAAAVQPFLGLSSRLNPPQPPPQVQRP